jgi:hypothetical protein
MSDISACPPKPDSIITGAHCTITLEKASKMPEKFSCFRKSLKIKLNPSSPEPGLLQPNYLAFLQSHGTLSSVSKIPQTAPEGLVPLCPETTSHLCRLLPLPDIKHDNQHAAHTTTFVFQVLIE